MPPGVTVFDAASWNGIAIDSTCGGHGTCKKCKVQILDGTVPISRLDIRIVFPRAARSGLAAGLSGPGDDGPPGHRSSADDAPQGRDGRRRAPGHPSTGDPEALRRARRADASDQRTDWRDWLRRSTTSSCGSTSTRCVGCQRSLGQSDFKFTAVVVDNVLIDVEPGDTTEARYRHRLRPRYDDCGGHAARHLDGYPGRRGLDAQQAAALRC